MNKNELLERIEVAKANNNHFDGTREWLAALTEFVLEQPKEPEVESKLPPKTKK